MSQGLAFVFNTVLILIEDFMFLLLITGLFTPKYRGLIIFYHLLIILEKGCIYGTVLDCLCDNRGYLPDGFAYGGNRAGDDRAYA